ncbi:peroxiredoxin [Mycoplasmopsis agassizii]|uniref:peroxiredoxin n=1 Tax=Mycoplasmopsis agassizii TaxID=33922 RepID=UPI003526D8A8
MQTEFKKVKYNTVKELIKVGEKLSFKAVNRDLEEVDFKAKKVTVVSPFPAISTKVCDEQTRGLSIIAEKYADKVDVVSISLDLPFTLADWCGAHGVENVDTLSDWRYLDFGKKTGFLVDKLHLLNRGVIIVDENSVVKFVTANTNIHDQINFEEVNTELDKLIK